MRWNTLLSLTALAAVVGCGYQPAPAPPKPAPSPQASTKPASQSPTPAPATQSGMTGGMQAIGGAAGLAPMDMAGGPQGVAPVRPATPPPQPGPTYEQAKPGVGALGKGYGGGLITTPIATYFSARERIAFEKLKHTMNLYKADKGNAPKTQQEFDAMVKENGVELPRLQGGERYVYKPETEELFVEHPPR